MNQAKLTTRMPLLQNRPFVVLITAQLISNLGDWLHILALITLVGFKWQATPWEIMILSICMAIPMMIGGPISGYISDKMNRKHLMIVSDILRAVFVMALIFAGSLWQVYTIIIIKGFIDSLFSPAKSGKIKEIVPSEHMDSAVALSSGIEQITKIVGPALGGLLVAAFGIQACFLIDGGSFLLSAVILLGIPGVSSKTTAKVDQDSLLKNENNSSFWKELSAGMTQIMAMPLVCAGLIVLIMVLVVLQIADSQTVTLFRNIPGVSEDLLGWCIGASGLGTLVSALIVGKFRVKPLSKMGIGAAMMGLVFAVAPLIAQQGEAASYFLFIAFLIAGFGGGMAFIPFQTMVQLRTPSSLTGRVFGTVNSLTSAAVILGPVLGGVLVSTYGPNLAFIVSGSLMLLMGVAVMFVRIWIEKRDIDPSQTEGLQEIPSS
ncbi:MFS transporter [Paenibacillus glacialis]|uniref:MFS transporter n=1 Tax=Paenibacillus glacialis TaxID=494026 RepID=A0A162PWB0_9BACL|nr:MFS transporter [Paenibacillus glacialis]OAB39830.1 MFS transporter [Paenibacillus glacialis]